MIRTFFFYIAVFMSSLVHASTAVIASLLRVPQRPGRVYDWSTRDWGKWILVGAGTPVIFEGAEKIPRGVPVVYACNHTSMFDIWALAAELPGSVRFVAKAELARIPLLGPSMVRAGHVMIDRDNKARAIEAYEKAIATIKSGISAVVFPEGTRSQTGELLPFKNAPFGLAISAQVPLVPLYVDGAFRILPKGSRSLHPRPIHVRVGDPIDTTGLTLTDRKKLRERAYAAIAALRDAH
jgi:1-acyl-sn-glycerol-3-phosphate acyltransferase